MFITTLVRHPADSTLRGHALFVSGRDKSFAIITTFDRQSAIDAPEAYEGHYEIGNCITVLSYY